MSTKFYLTNNSQALSPAYSSFWDKTGNADRKLMSISKVSTLTSKGFSENVTTNNYKILNRQYISAALEGNQTLSGQVSGQITCFEDSSNANFYGAWHIRVVDENLNTVGILATGFSPTEFVKDVATNRKIPILSNINPVDLTGYQACIYSGYIPSSGVSGSGQWVCTQSGYKPFYYIVFEVGAVAKNTSSTTFSGSQFFGASSSTDLPVDETTTAIYNPWLSFSQNINML